MVYTRVYKILKIGLLVLTLLVSLFLFSNDSKACTSAEPVTCSDGTNYSCGFYRANGSAWVCSIRHNLAVWPYCTNTASATNDTYCTNADITLEQDACPNTGLYNGEQCRVADGADPPFGCVLTGVRCWAQTGVWDASERECVTCSGRTQDRRLGDTGQRCINLSIAGWPGCGISWSDLACASTSPPSGTFETACDSAVDAACDELNQGDVCGAGLGCDANGQCVSICGDGIIVGGEQCDPGPPLNLGGETCASLPGFDGGILSCDASCNFDTSGCYFCGDGSINPGEICDPGPPEDLGGEDCSSQGESGGNLDCLGNCSGFDVSGCYTCDDDDCEVANGECRDAACGTDDCGVAETTICCGNTRCDTEIGENFGNCAADCTTFTCGDAACSPGECIGCKGDCTVADCCGDGRCEPGYTDGDESYRSCPDDCPPSAVRRGVLQNPLTQAENIPEAVALIGDLIFYVGLALVTLMVLIGGVMFLTSAGDPAKITTAKRLLFWTAIGAAVTIFSKAAAGLIRYILGG